MPLGKILVSLPFVIAAVLGYLLYTAQQKEDITLVSPMIGQQAPETDLPLLFSEGRLTQQSLLTADQPIVVNFFFSTCPPCLQEHPQLMQLSELGVRVYGIAHREPADRTAAFLNRLGNPYHEVAMDFDGQGRLAWGVVGWPETYILNTKGEIIYKHQGAILKDDLDGEFTKVLSDAINSK